MQWEAVIVGGSVAGLSAALVLGRCRRRTLVVDAGRPRNLVSRGVHGFLTQDGVSPVEFLRVARSQVQSYPTVQLRDGLVVDVARVAEGFEVVLEGPEHERVTTEKILFATGLIDELPPIEGVERFWGCSIFVCPFCDAWEERNQPTLVYGRTPDVYGFTLEMLQWSRTLTLCTDGADVLRPKEREHLRRIGVPICAEHVVRFEGGERVERAVFADGTQIPCRAVFMSVTQRQASPLPAKLGCHVLPDGSLDTSELQQTPAQGVFVAGNAARGLQMAIMAAAEGFRAAYAINEELLEDYIVRSTADLV